MKYYCEWIPHDLIKINSSYEWMNIQNQFLIATDFLCRYSFSIPKKSIHEIFIIFSWKCNWNVEYLFIQHCLLYFHLFCLISFKLSWTANQIKILLLAPNEFCCCQQLQPFGCPTPPPPLRLVPPQAAAAAVATKNLQIEFAVSCQDGWLTQMTSLCIVCPSVADNVPATVHCPHYHCT